MQDPRFSVPGITLRPDKGSAHFCSGPSSWHWIFGFRSKLHNEWKCETSDVDYVRGRREINEICQQVGSYIAACGCEIRGKDMQRKTRRGSKYEGNGRSYAKHVNRKSCALVAFQRANRLWRPTYHESVERLAARCPWPRLIRLTFAPSFSRFRPRTSPPVG